jgi:hypothetical protein
VGFLAGLEPTVTTLDDRGEEVEEKAEAVVVNVSVNDNVIFWM